MQAVQGKKVQTQVAVLSGAGGAPLDAGARQQSGQGQAPPPAKRKSGKAAAAAGDSAAAGGGKAAKRVKK